MRVPGYFMENFNQSFSGRSDALKQRMDELKAQLEKCKEEYEQVRREEFREAVRRFLEEFHIETIEDLNRAAMKLRGMNPEIVKEAARNIRGKDVSRAQGMPVLPKSARYEKTEPDHVFKQEKPAGREIPAAEETIVRAAEDVPVKAAEETPHEDVQEKDSFFAPDELPDAEPPKAEDHHVETFFDEEPAAEPPAEEKEEVHEETPVAEPAAEEADEPSQEPVSEPQPAEKEDDFDLNDEDFDMDWDFGDDDSEKADSAPAEEEAKEDAPQKELTAEDIADLAAKIGRVQLSDEQVGALRSKQPVVRAAGKLLQSILTAKQELAPSMKLNEISTLYDYNPDAMQSGSTRDKYKEADRLISVLDENITENDTPEAYPAYQEFKGFPDFIRSRAMTLVAMEIEAYFA